MSIRSIEDAKILKDYCKKIGREGMGDEVSSLAKQIVEAGGDYPKVMRLAGQIRAITTGAQVDIYFGEKVGLGFSDMRWKAHEATFKKQ